MLLSASAPEKLFGEVCLGYLNDVRLWKPLPNLGTPLLSCDDRKLCCWREPGRLKVEPERADWLVSSDLSC